MGKEKMVFGQRLIHAEVRNGFPVMPEGFVCMRKYNGWSVISLPETRDDELGISGLWTIGRSGNPIAVNAPFTFLDNIPEVVAHYELWHSETDSCAVVSSIVNGSDDSRWSELSLVLIGGPSQCGCDPLDSSTWENLNNDSQWEELASGDNVHKIGSAVGNGWVVLPEKFDSFVDPVEKGWEGSVFAPLNGPYICGRNNLIQKFKPYYEDESDVVGYEYSKTGRVTLVAELIISEKHISVYGGKLLPVGKSIQFRLPILNKSESKKGVAESLYPVGSEVPFKYESFSGTGTPVNCSIFFGDV